MTLMTQGQRKLLIDQIKTSENKERKAESLKQVEIFNDRILQYVSEELRRRFDEGTVREMPIISSINLARRIVKQEAAVYRDEPKRTFTDLSDDQANDMFRIYDKMDVDSKLKKSNESFKLQNQNHIMIIPKDGELKLRVLRNHHLDSIPDPNDPETAMGYVISAFDKTDYLEDYRNTNNATGFVGDSRRNTSSDSNRTNEKIGDEDDFESLLEKYVVWTKEFNFMMDGNGNILNDEGVPASQEEIEANDQELIRNPFGIIPIIDISIEKDFEYWVRQGEGLTEFTRDYNVMLSSVAQVVNMQGFAQAYMIGSQEQVVSHQQVGPNSVVKLEILPDGTKPEFGFANPGSDIAGSINFVEVVLANFLTSRGVDPETIAGKLNSSASRSGVQELLKMIKQFTVSKDDFAIYKRVEQKLYGIMKVILNTIQEDERFIEYRIGQIPESSEVNVKFKEPSMIETKSEKFKAWNEGIEAQLASRRDAVADIYELEGESVDAKIEEIDELNSIGGVEVADQ